MRLKDRVAMVTGGASGLGRAIARGFAQEGANLVISYNESEAGARELAADAEKMGLEVVAVQADLTKGEDRKRLVESAVARFGRIDILVNNAGIAGGFADIDEITEEMWDRLMAINLKAPFFLAREVAKIMLQNKHGKIINISSIVGIKPVKGGLHYSVSKAAIIHMTKILAINYAPYVQVNAVAPGFMEHRMRSARLRPGVAISNVEQERLRKIPAGRFGRLDELAETCVFLASSASDYITGQVIALEGGVLLT